MKRRSFIAAAVAALAAPYLPAAELSEVAPSVAEWNTASLTAAIEKMFSCQPGPAAPFFDLVAGAVTAVPMVEKKNPLYPNLTVEEFAEAKDPNQRYRYETYACSIKGGSAEEAEARLAKHFYEKFSQLPAGQLVWRTQPQFSTEEVVEYGLTWMTAEQAEDFLGKSFVQVGKENVVDCAGVHVSQFSKPVFVYKKGEKLEIPEGVEYDPINGSYRYVKSKYTLHRMRMRLVIPHLYDHDEETVAIPELFKPEGALTPVI